MVLYVQRRHPLSSLFEDNSCFFLDWEDEEDLLSKLPAKRKAPEKEERKKLKMEEKNSSSDQLMSFSMGNCAPENIKINIKEGILHVECKEEEENGFKFIRYERSLPKNVDPNSLIANLRPDGELEIQLQPQSTQISITHEEKSS